MSALGGVRIAVVGAGLAGLAAARDLLRSGADVTVVDARPRAGGRVWTIREPFAYGQHAEAGGDLIDEGQAEIARLARELKLELVPILRGGFGYVRCGPSGRPRIVARTASRGWPRLMRALAELSRRYALAEGRWDSPIIAELARRSVADWLDETGADEELRATAEGLRGFFLADPQELSLAALVDQFASSQAPAGWRTYRIRGGNDRLAAALAAGLGSRLRLNTEAVAASCGRSSVRLKLRARGSLGELTADYVLFAVPAPLAARIQITPPLPQAQREALSRLKYGRASKTLLQFGRRFWRRPGRPLAFGSPLPVGAVWDGAEEQRGPAGILSLLAGGSASDETRAITAAEGVDGLVRRLAWLGARGAVLEAFHQTVWESDEWAHGGYAFFDPAFDQALRGWLARPAGRLFFAGEHTSIRWQGYMNGAIESGRRAAAEIEAAHRLATRR